MRTSRRKRGCAHHGWHRYRNKPWKKRKRVADREHSFDPRHRWPHK